MRTSIPGSTFSTNLPTVDPNFEFSEDKLFKKFIMRRNIEDSLFDDSRENALSNKKLRKSTLMRKASPSPNESPRKGSLGDLFSSPRRKQTNLLIQGHPSSNYRRAESRSIGKSVIYGDKLNKKQAKNTHPMTQFVGFSDQGRSVQEQVRRYLQDLERRIRSGQRQPSSPVLSLLGKFAHQKDNSVQAYNKVFQDCPQCHSVKDG